MTQILSWLWCLYVNPVIAVPTAIFAVRLLANQSEPESPRIDLLGLATGSLGLFALVYGFSNAETHSWTATGTVGSLIASVLLLSAFVVIEQRVKNPLLPLHIVWDRARGGAYISVLLRSAGVFGVFFFLTYYLQLPLHFSPLTTGFAFLPMTALIIGTSLIAQTKVLGLTGARPLVATGMALGLIAMILFSRLTPSSSYAKDVLPGLLIMGLGMGCIFAPALGTATLGVEVDETGVAPAIVNTAQQVGGSIGLALLSALSASASGNYLKSQRGVPGLASLAAVHGYTTSFVWAAGIFGLGRVLSLLIIPRKALLPAGGLRAALARGLTFAHHVELADPVVPPAA